MEQFPGESEAKLTESGVKETPETEELSPTKAGVVQDSDGYKPSLPARILTAEELIADSRYL